MWLWSRRYRRKSRMVGTRIVSSTSNVGASTIWTNDVCYKSVTDFIKIYESRRKKTDLCESHNLLAQPCPVSSIKFDVPYTPSRRFVVFWPLPRIIRQPSSPTYKVTWATSCLKNSEENAAEKEAVREEVKKLDESREGITRAIIGEKVTREPPVIRCTCTLLESHREESAAIRGFRGCRNEVWKCMYRQRRNTYNGDIELNYAYFGQRPFFAVNSHSVSYTPTGRWERELGVKLRWESIRVGCNESNLCLPKIGELTVPEAFIFCSTMACGWQSHVLEDKLWDLVVDYG